MNLLYNDESHFSLLIDHYDLVTQKLLPVELLVHIDRALVRRVTRF